MDFNLTSFNALDYSLTKTVQGRSRIGQPTGLPTALGLLKSFAGDGISSIGFGDVIEVHSPWRRP